MSFPISNERQFGFVIAYVIPGFLVLNGISLLSPTVASWLAKSSCDPTIGGFLYSVLASLLAGLTCSTVRWLLVDTLHFRFGLKAKKWKMELLARNIDAFEIIVAYHYRYYQFYGNMLISLPISFTLFALSGPGNILFWRVALLAAIIEILFFAGSRDSFKKYVTRSNELLESRSNLIV